MRMKRNWAAALSLALLFSLTLSLPALAHGRGNSGGRSYQTPSFGNLNAPKNLKIASKTGDTVQLTWSAVQRAKGYEVYRNGVKVATVAKPVYTDNGLAQNTAYSYTVKTLDSANRVSKATASVGVTTQIVITGEVTWTAEGGPYTVGGGLVVPEGASLHIEPGVVVKIKPGESIFVYGFLNAMGDEDNRVVFTSTKDKAYGGCGVRSSCDYWKTILVAPGATFSGDYVKIVYGDVLATVKGMLTLTNSEAAYSRTLGIQVESTGEFNGTFMNIHDCCEATQCRGIVTKGVVNLSLSQITDCPGIGVLVEKTGSFNSTNNVIRGSERGVEVRGVANLVLTQITGCKYGLYFDTLSENGVILNALMGNNCYGIYNKRSNDITIQAVSNYWGSPNGPAVYDAAARQWVGDGDRVSTGVNYADWLAEPAN